MLRFRLPHRTCRPTTSAIRFLACLAALVCGIVCAALPAPDPAAAASCTVTTLADSGGGSLRTALADEGCGSIGFQTGLTGTITLQSALPTIARNLAIAGPGAGSLAISGGGVVRVLAVRGNVTVAIGGLTLRDGDDGPGPGGGLWISEGAKMTVADAEISSNQTDFYGGGIAVEGSTLLLVSSRVVGNNAVTGGGLALANSVATVRNSAIEGNAATSGGGIAAFGRSTATLTATSVSENAAMGKGGGIGVERGGALTLVASVVANNSAAGLGPDAGGGGIFLADQQFEAGPTMLINSTVSGNTANDGEGGGVRLWAGGNLVVRNSEISGNTASSGGGFALEGAGLTLAASTVSGNVAHASGGGIYDIFGAGIIVTSSTISGNSADGGGGGIMAVAASARLEFVTITDNVSDANADSYVPGGGLYVNGLMPQLPVAIRNSIVVGNRLGDGSANDCEGTVPSDGGNIWGDQTACPNNSGAGDRNLAALGLTPLQVLKPTLLDNGGPTKTHALVPGSPAIDRVAAASACPNDQRGAHRPHGATCDSGAVEFEGFVPEVCAVFADVPAGDVSCEAIRALSTLGIIQGYGTVPPTYGPDDSMERAQMAAFLVRAFHWYAEPVEPGMFNDFGGLVGELRSAPLIVANRCAANGEGCVAQGYGDGRFGPADPVSYAQAISLIARACQIDEACGWEPQPGEAIPYSGVPAVHERDIRTFHHYAGAIPDAPTTAEGWSAPAPRGWIARVVYAALRSRR